MPPLRDLLPLLGEVSGDPGDVVVTGVTHDSRRVAPGDLYAALPGSRSHGAEFAAQAAAAGAVAMLTDRAGTYPLPALVVGDPRKVLGRLAAEVHGNPSRAMDVLGVTGTNGKTTTAYLLEAGLRAAGRTTGLIGTVETRVAGEALPSAHTTPEAPDLQRLLATMRDRGATGVAMEVSSHGLALGRVDGTWYAASIFTNLSQDHLDFHPDMEAYFKAKASLFTAERSAVAVVNVDDAYGERLLHRTRIPVVTTSAAGKSHADWRATGDGEVNGRPLRLKLPGAYNVDNALGAIAALVSIGIDEDTAFAGVESLEGVPGRMERVDAGQPWLAVVDYAHTPESLATVLRALRPSTEGALIVVFGAGGDRDAAKRPLMGQAAARGADLAIVTSDNPRSEDPLAIVAAVQSGARQVEGAKVVVEPDREAAIGFACAQARPGDTVVVAGKGHEQGQTFADRTVPFDDRVVLRRAIEAVLA